MLDVGGNIGLFALQAAEALGPQVGAGAGCCRWVMAALAAARSSPPAAPACWPLPVTRPGGAPSMLCPSGASPPPPPCSAPVAPPP